MRPGVLVIGGGEDKVQDRKILRTFIEYAGGTEAKVGILPCASREPEIIGRIYQQIFTELGAQLVEVLDFRERLTLSRTDAHKLLEKFTGIFMTGGDQLRLCSMIGATEFSQLMNELLAQGRLVVAGTSAGAAAMAYHMISGGSSGETPHKEIVTMSTGLGILPHIIVDQHFHNRNRMARLMTAIAAYPDLLGVGIDEDTCAIFEPDQIMKVIGKGTVTIIDSGEVSYSNQLWASGTTPLTIHNLKVHVLSAGSKYHLSKRIPLSPT